jgi:phosphatidylglycerophosphate synthase
MSPSLSRRPIASRDRRWAIAAAHWLAERGVKPNTISIASVLFAATAGSCLVASGYATDAWGQAACLIGAAAGIQLRLLCNLLDGMVAVEHGRQTRSGPIYNELPDRFADLFILCGAGYSNPAISWLPAAGWAAAASALLTAYVRALGASAGADQQFLGPMAKPHRMAVLILSSLIASAAALVHLDLPVLACGVLIVIAGCIVTIARRTLHIIAVLDAQ